MKLTRIVGVSAFVLSLLACGPRPSDENTTAVGRPSGTTFLLRNHSRETICYVHIASADADWGLDRLGPTEVILPGGAREWDFAAGTYKVRLRDCNRNDLMMRENVTIADDGVVLTFRERESVL